MCVCGFFVLNFRIEILHMSFFSVSCVKQRMRERDFSIVHSYTNTFEHFCFKHSINCCVYSLSIDSFLLTFKWQMKCFGSLTEYTSFVIITIRLGQRHPLIDSNLLSFFSLCSQLEFARRHAKSEKKNTRKKLFTLDTNLWNLFKMHSKPWMRRRGRKKLNVNCVAVSISCRSANTFNLVRNIISFALCAFIMQVHVQRTT